MNFVAFTSMDEKYYNHCGKAMLQSYKANLSDLMPMYVYNEDDFQIKVKTVMCKGWNLGKKYKEFQDRHNNERTKTFAKKGFSIIDATNSIDADRLVWFDADTIIKSRPPLQLFELIAPDDVLSTHFSVWHNHEGKTYHSCETGFFILNKQHPGFNDFKRTYADIYYNDKTEGLRRFYDGEVYGKTVELMEAQGHKMLNLNPNRYKTPISRSVVAPYITHFKAGVKEQVDFDNMKFNED
jgi:hypothetical protein